MVTAMRTPMARSHGHEAFGFCRVFKGGNGAGSGALAKEHGRGAGAGAAGDARRNSAEPLVRVL